MDFWPKNDDMTNKKEEGITEAITFDSNNDRLTSP